MKKILATMVFMLMAVSSFSEEVVVDGIKYNAIEKSGQAEVIKNNPHYSGDIVIPETITVGGKEYTVNAIGSQAFQNCTGLISVSIPNSVTLVGEYAFENCTHLPSVTIPNSVTRISSKAFANCSAMTSIFIGKSVTGIGDMAFDGCTALNAVHVSNLSNWCMMALYNSTNPLYYAHNLYVDGNLVKDLVIPSTVTRISDSVFENCTSITSVTIPNSVTSIGWSAFENCTGLTSVTIPESVTTIKQEAFYDCM